MTSSATAALAATAPARTGAPAWSGGDHRSCFATSHAPRNTGPNAQRAARQAACARHAMWDGAGDGSMSGDDAGAGR